MHSRLRFNGVGRQIFFFLLFSLRIRRTAYYQEPPIVTPAYWKCDAYSGCFVMYNALRMRATIGLPTSV